MAGRTGIYKTYMREGESELEYLARELARFDVADFLAPKQLNPIGETNLGFVTLIDDDDGRLAAGTVAFEILDETIDYRIFHEIEQPVAYYPESLFKLVSPPKGARDIIWRNELKIVSDDELQRIEIPEIKKQDETTFNKDDDFYPIVIAFSMFGSFLSLDGKSLVGDAPEDRATPVMRFKNWEEAEAYIKKNKDYLNSLGTPCPLWCVRAGNT